MCTDGLCASILTSKVIEISISSFNYNDDSRIYKLWQEPFSNKGKGSCSSKAASDRLTKWKKFADNTLYNETIIKFFRMANI